MILKLVLDAFATRLRGISWKQSDRIYIIKEGDNLSSIADKFGVPLAVLIIWNRLDMKKPIHPGDRLIIYPKK